MAGRQGISPFLSLTTVSTATYNQTSYSESAADRSPDGADVFTRTTGFFIVPLWVLAMGWLVAHDAWPRWNAKPPPPIEVTEWLRDEGRKSQYALHDEFGRMGTVWTEYLIDINSIQRNDLIFMERVPPILAGFAPLRVKVESTHTAAGVLDEITVRLEAAHIEVLLHGERFHSDFSFKLESGLIDRTFKIPLSSAGLITGAFNPFGSLTKLKVGQTLNMQGVNPLAIVAGIGDGFIPLMVEVTGETRLSTPYGEHNCMVVEAAGAKAWVDARGAVIQQEAQFPLLGKLTILREPSYDQDAAVAARNTVIVGRPWKRQ